MNNLFKNLGLATLAVTLAIPVTLSTSTTAHSNSGRDAFVGGLLGGVIGGAVGSRRKNPDVIYVEPRQERRRPARINRHDAHVNWCYDRYRSYSERSDTYITHSGRERRCRSPY